MRRNKTRPLLLERVNKMEAIIADKNTWRSAIKKVDGDAMVLVAVQKSRRTRGGRTTYVFSRSGTQNIYYNRSRNGILFMPIAASASDMARYYDVFAREPTTAQEKAWLDRNDYTLVE